MIQKDFQDLELPDLSNRWKDLWTLVDGAYSLVEVMDTSDSPYNKKWKENWLRRAEELGVTPEF